MNFLKRILLFVGVVILTLHSIVPHFHGNEYGEEPHVALHQESVESLLDYLSLFFHETTEEGQMDHLVSSPEFQFTVQFSEVMNAVPTFNEQLFTLNFYNPPIPEQSVLFKPQNAATIHFSRPPPVV